MARSAELLPGAFRWVCSVKAKDNVSPLGLSAIVGSTAPPFQTRRRILLPKRLCLSSNKEEITRSARVIFGKVCGVELPDRDVERWKAMFRAGQ